MRETLASLRDHYLNKECNIRILSEEDIRHKCTTLKCRKAAGVDGITGENLKYGGPVLHTCISFLFNSIITHKVIPDQLKRAVIIPIQKNKVVHHNVSMGSDVYVTLCDVRKAYYDTVNYDCLFYKLYRMGCNNILWQIIMNFYAGFKSCVFLGSQ